MKEKSVFIILALAFFLLSACNKGSDIITEQDLENEENTIAYENTKEDDKENTNEENELVAVYVCGAVTNPGVYYLKKDAIRLDALNQAGGLLEDAAQGYVNLAKRISDGEQIYFPYADEVDVSVEFSEKNDFEIGEEASEGKVNINLASKEELMTLPGIGESKAAAIIKYREQNGLFKNNDEIKNINGIKDGVFNNIKNYITLN